MGMSKTPFSTGNMFLVIDSRSDEVDKLRSSVNSNFISINSPNDLVEQVEIASDRRVDLTIVITKHLPDKIKNNGTYIKSVLDLIWEDETIKSAIFEISLEEDKVYPQSLSFESIDDFIYHAKSTRAIDAVENSTFDETSQSVISDLNKDNIELHEEIKEVREVSKSNQEKFDELSDKIIKLQEEKSVLVKQKEQAISEKEIAEKEFKDRENKVSSLEMRIDSLVKSLSDKENEIANLQVNLAEMDKNREVLIAKINSLDVRIFDLEELNESLSNKNNLLENSNTDLSSSNSSVKEIQSQIYKYKDEVTELRSQLVSKDIDLRSRDETIKNLRDLNGNKGNLDTVLPIIKFNNVKLMYFRVLTELPRFQWYVRRMPNYLKSFNSNLNVRIVNIKKDTELDVHFQGVDKVGNIGSSSEYEESLLIPNTSMSDGNNHFESETDLVIILDYTGKRETLVETGGVRDDYLVVSNEKDGQSLNIQGSMITESKTTSVLDLEYDSDFVVYPETISIKVEEVLGNFFSVSKNQIWE